MNSDGKMPNKNFIILGGEFNNKGAQAMTFTVMDEIRKVYPSANITLASSFDFNKNRNEYRINIIPTSLLANLYASGWIYRIISLFSDKVLCPFYHILHNSEDTDRYIHLYDNALKNADCVIDISGFALSSKWSWVSSISYLFRIAAARKYNVPYIILPQSFGPFDYQKYGKIVKYFIKKYMPYPRIIFVREKDGYNELKKIACLSNLIISPDLVLQNKSLLLENIYTVIPDFKNISVQNEIGNIAIVPNFHLLDKIDGGNITDLLNLYKLMIDYLLQEGKTVYLIYHAGEDRQICDDIKKLYFMNKNVINVSDELNCIEYESFIKKCDFVISSRFHSIVHAYKECIPCMIFGWAIKYSELAELMGQKYYYHDMRTRLIQEEIMTNLKYLLEHHNEESERIKKRLIKVQKHSCFDGLFSNL